MYSYLLTGLIAGIASSVLYISGSIGASLSLFLYFLAPLPLFITGLGWGAVSAVAGAIAGVIVCVLIAGPLTGLVYFITIGLIPIVLCYYALMSRASDEDTQTSSKSSKPRDWYPLGSLILWIAGFATALTAVVILFIMPSTPELKPALTALFEAILDQNPQLKARLGGEEAVLQLVGLFIALLPTTLASYTFVSTGFNLWLASKIITTSGRNIRPAFVLSSTRYPTILPLVLVGMVAVSFLPGALHTIALAGSTALTLTFMFLGLLVIHALVPEVPARAVFLGMIYVTVFILLKYAYFVIALVGIAETVFGIRQRFARARPPSNINPPPGPSGD